MLGDSFHILGTKNISDKGSFLFNAGLIFDNLYYTDKILYARKNNINANIFCQAYPDPEYKLNKAAMTVEGLPVMPQLGHTSLTYSSLFPNTSVMINWHNQQCDLCQVRKQWLVSNRIVYLLTLSLYQTI